ncbi:MAG: DUF4292 domain-containing protein [Winogradskyella sp.]|nr:DUF4292 domain-containing protein [Winogradskyella sp.]
MKHLTFFITKKIGIVFIITLSLLSFVSCKSTKSIVNSSEPNTSLSTRQIIREYQKQETNFKTLQGKVKINITQDQKEQGSTFTLRIEKDKAIWLSATLGLARLMITPDRVRFYNKLDNEYFDGDYDLLSDFVGVELDFFKVQNILLGQAIFNLKSQEYATDINEQSYVLHPKDQNALMELFYLINPSHFKLDSLQLFQQLKNRMLQVDYESYQQVKKQTIPNKLRVIAFEDNEEVTIDMEFKSISLNEDVRFPFNIPSGYKEIVIK